MSSKIRHYFKSETGKATARGFVAGVASMCIVWPLSLAMTAGAVMPFALGLTGSIGLCSTAAILNHRAEKKAGMPINSLVSKQWRGWVAGSVTGLVLLGFFPTLTQARKAVAKPAPQSMTEIAPSPHKNLNETVNRLRLSVPRP